MFGRLVDGFLGGGSNGQLHQQQHGKEVKKHTHLAL
jgi:hypothetical protein